MFICCNDFYWKVMIARKYASCLNNPLLQEASVPSYLFCSHSQWWPTSHDLHQNIDSIEHFLWLRQLGNWYIVLGHNGQHLQATKHLVTCSPCYHPVSVTCCHLPSLTAPNLSFARSLCQAVFKHLCPNLDRDPITVTQSIHQVSKDDKGLKVQQSVVQYFNSL